MLQVDHPPLTAVSESLAPAPVLRILPPVRRPSLQLVEGASRQWRIRPLGKRPGLQHWVKSEPEVDQVKLESDATPSEIKTEAVSPKSTAETPKSAIEVNAFDTFDKKTSIFEFSPEEYQQYLVDPQWTMAETQRLLELARRFDLRFIVIEDQYNSNLEGPVKSEPPSDLTAEVAQLQTMQSNKLHLAQQLQQLQLVMQQQQQAGQTINPQLVTAFAGLSAQFQQVNNQSILLQQSLQQKAGQLQAQRPRTCEQLQERFYAVQKQLLCVRVLSELKLPAPNQQQPQQSYTFPSAHLASGVDLSKHPLFARSFDAAHERNRRAALAKLLERTPDEEKRMVSLVLGYRALDRSIQSQHRVLTQARQQGNQEEVIGEEESLRGQVREYFLPRSVAAQRSAQALSQASAAQGGSNRQKGAATNKSSKPTNNSSVTPAAVVAAPQVQLPKKGRPSLAVSGSGANSLMGSVHNSPSQTYSAAAQAPPSITLPSATPAAASSSSSVFDFQQHSGPIDHNMLLADLPGDIAVKPEVCVRPREPGVHLRSKQTEQQLQYLQARTSKTLDSEMASLKFDKNAPVAHTSAATCTQFDQVRCDVATLVQLRRHIDVVLKPERDELRTKVAARKKAATPGVPTPFAASASATPTAASAVKKRVLPAVPTPTNEDEQSVKRARK